MSEGSRYAATAGYSGIIGTSDINVTTQSRREETEHGNRRSGGINARDTQLTTERITKGKKELGGVVK